ncbi:baseplate multidomain protein megatron [Histidinibacterium aquaticum]|uniref:Host specificity protein n=1 Tax=Histidinibacterium aquaticum TaxID=2613962 RepID=A0A5J5GMW4_9RHOB|nr:glycoside hydrolase/phage tail family protein [Histidinibacterium aquaticum]KAA9009043.1 host specificity protein [Histidinibacterium aquaticum]
MATIVLGAAGMAVGGSVGGSVLGLSSSVIGRAAGATLGRWIDARLMGQGSEPVETGRVDRFRLPSASEGAPVGRVYGRMRVAGQVIWASAFREESDTSGGGKGRPRQPEVTELSYSVSLAVALCEGEVTSIGRIWADGREVPAHRLNMRLYRGTGDQLPDPKIAAVEGADHAPAYRGIAYLVFEDLPLGQFGNRVPAFSFEVLRPGASREGTPPDVARAVKGVALMPGSGEYALATEPVEVSHGYGETVLANVHTPDGRADAVVALDQLEAELPECGAVSLVVSWFGDDLRAGDCTLRPKVERAGDDGSMPWRVGGLDRETAQVVPEGDEGPVYGGTPTDQSVVQIIREMRGRGQHVTFYPFILMDQLAGNALPDPYSGEAGQAHLPWRGRITTSLAEGMTGTPQGTAQADAEVSAIFGSCAPEDFAPGEDTVDYAGPDEWSYRRFILHYAHLCAAAGGVEAFCIGSEMRGLTTVRGASGYPAVERLRTLAQEVRAILPGAKIGYAADWSEYHGHQPAGTQDKRFHLDPLWADPAIDFIGIDNYMPLSDWRDVEGHADAGWGSIHDLDYLRANVEGGEGYDWYYASEADRAAQIRTPITDFYGEAWLWRVKDLRGWWSNYHHDRVGGARAPAPTDWTPGMKPIWFTEFGCPAIDKGTNEPNKFVDPKSSESTVPRFSTGEPDELIQLQYVRAMVAHWSDPANNPVSDFSGLQMIDMDRAHYWAWDARPWPAFPGRPGIWSDGANWERGHWITGRTAHRPLSDVVEEIVSPAELEGLETDRLWGLVRGYAVETIASARSALQPLMLAHGVDAVERGGGIVFASRSDSVSGEVALADLVEGEPDLERMRDDAAPGERLSLSFVAAGAGYEAAAVEVSRPGELAREVSRSELPMVLTRDEARGIGARWLAEAQAARDTARFALPPSLSALGAGDVVRLQGHSGALFRIDRAETGLSRQVEATRIPPGVYGPAAPGALSLELPEMRVPGPAEGLFLDLPQVPGVEAGPRFVAVARPWPGPVALYASGAGEDHALQLVQSRPAAVGLTETPLASARPGRWDRGQALRVRMLAGELSSVGQAELLSGANLAAVGDGETWEVIQFREAELVAPSTYELRMRLRGQGGTDGTMPEVWPPGSFLVPLTPRLGRVEGAEPGMPRDYRWGPADQPPGHTSYRSAVRDLGGAALRPWPVCHLEARAEGENIAITWIRRARLGGDGWRGWEVPLAEGQERYLLRVRSEGGGLLREALTESPGFTYTAAMQAADALNGTPATVEVAQVSDLYGPGPATRAELPR